MAVLMLQLLLLQLQLPACQRRRSSTELAVSLLRGSVLRATSASTCGSCYLFVHPLQHWRCSLCCLP